MSTILSLRFQGAETTGNHSWGVLQIGLAWSQHSAPGVILKSFPQTGFLALFPWSSSQHWSFPKLGSSWRSREVKTSSFLHSPAVLAPLRRTTCGKMVLPFFPWWSLLRSEHWRKKKKTHQNSPGAGDSSCILCWLFDEGPGAATEMGGGVGEGPP